MEKHEGKERKQPQVPSRDQVDKKKFDGHSPRDFKVTNQSF